MHANDIDQVVSLYKQVMHPAYMGFGELKEGYSDAPGVPSKRAIELFRESLLPRIDSSDVGMFVASIGDTIVGFAIAVLNQTNAGHLECWLEDTGVSHDWRQHGIAQQLVMRIIDWGTQKDAKYFLLEAGVDNKEAQNLYRRLGYHPLSTVFYRGQSG